MSVRPAAIGLLWLGLSAGAGAQAPGAPGPSAPPPAIGVPPANQVTPPLGTLFFTPAERANMDRLRKIRSAGLPGDDAGVEARSQINGFVKRSDGRSTLWVDGAALSGVGAEIAARVTAQSVGMDSYGVLLRQSGEATVTPDNDKKPGKKPVKRQVRKPGATAPAAP